MGTIGPKADPRPLILHVDSDTNIPYRLAEADSLVLGGTLQADTVSATNYIGFAGSFTGITDIYVTGGATSLVFTSTPTSVTIKSFDVGDTFFGIADNPAGKLDFGFGTTPLPVANGGTNATTTGDARTNLGLSIGSNVQAWSTSLDALAGLTPTNDNFIVGDGSTWKAKTPSQARTSLGLGTADNPQFNTVELGHASDTTLARSTLGGDITIEGNLVYRAGGTDVPITDGGTGASTASDARTNLGLAIGTNVQAYNANLAAIAGLAVTDNNFIVGNGSTWVAESGSTARTSLGLGTMATVNSPVPITDGGTGQTTQNAALNALLPSQGSNTGKYLKTDGTNTSWDTPAGGGSWTSVFKTADQSVVGITETDDTSLSCTIDSNAKYAFRLQAQFDDNAWGYQFAVSSGANPNIHYSYETFESVTKTVYNEAGAGATIPTYQVTPAGSNGYGFVRITGLIDNSSGGSTAFKYRFCSSSASKTTYTKAGSFLEYRKL